MQISQRTTISLRQNCILNLWFPESEIEDGEVDSDGESFAVLPTIQLLRAKRISSPKKRRQKLLTLQKTFHMMKTLMIFQWNLKFS
jgi:hypothetical protein